MAPGGDPNPRERGWQASWDSAVGTWDELVAKDGWPQSWFRDALMEMRTWEELEGLYAHTSMSTVILSRFADWPAWRENSRIVLEPASDLVRVSLHHEPFESLRGPDVTGLAAPAHLRSEVLRMLALAGW